MKHSPRLLLVVGFLTASLLGGLIGAVLAPAPTVVALAPQPISTAPAPPSTMRPMVVTKVLYPSCGSTSTVTGTYAKVKDIGNFDVNSPESVIEITYNGRFQVDMFGPSTNGVAFEMRVDNNASSKGQARAMVFAAEASQKIFGSMTGMFTGLSAGTHTVSVWAQASNSGSASGARIDPGCFSADHVVIKEFLPFGFVFMPSVAN